MAQSGSEVIVREAGVDQGGWNGKEVSGGSPPIANCLINPESLPSTTPPHLPPPFPHTLSSSNSQRGQQGQEQLGLQGPARSCWELGAGAGILQDQGGLSRFGRTSGWLAASHVLPGTQRVRTRPSLGMEESLCLSLWLFLPSCHFLSPALGAPAWRTVTKATACSVAKSTHPFSSQSPYRRGDI